LSVSNGVRNGGAPELRIRRAESGDAEAIARLSGELGYPAQARAVSARLALLASRADEAVLVAEEREGGAIAGWIQISEVRSLESEPWAEIRGLVVGRCFRRWGTGRALVENAERWARERELCALRVRTNVLREEARRFYPAVGFRLVKTQDTWTKSLPSGAGSE